MSERERERASTLRPREKVVDISKQGCGVTVSMQRVDEGILFLAVLDFCWTSEGIYGCFNTDGEGVCSYARVLVLW